MAILTISREYGSGGREIGRGVAEALGYGYVDRATVLAALHAEDPRWERWGEEYDEHAPSLWERFDWSFRGYTALLQRHLLEAAAADRVVIVGRGGNFLLAGVPTALRVRVAAPKAARIERILRREHADRGSIARLIERTDHERAGFIKAVYRHAWDDPAAYDRSYDTGLLEPATVIDDIRTRLAACDGADREAAGRVLGLRLAAARVRVRLFTDEHLQLPLLEVREDGAGILVTGVVHNPGEKQRVATAAGTCEGDHPVRVDLHYR